MAYAMAKDVRELFGWMVHLQDDTVVMITGLYGGNIAACGTQENVFPKDLSLPSIKCHEKVLQLPNSVTVAV